MGGSALAGQGRLVESSGPVGQPWGGAKANTHCSLLWILPDTDMSLLSRFHNKPTHHHRPPHLLRPVAKSAFFFFFFLLCPPVGTHVHYFPSSSCWFIGMSHEVGTPGCCARCCRSHCGSVLCCSCLQSNLDGGRSAQGYRNWRSEQRNLAQWDMEQWCRPRFDRDQLLQPCQQHV